MTYINMPEPFFSIIVPTFNRGELLLKTLQSFVCQDYREFEVLVIDDGSTDNTEVLVNNFINTHNQFKYFKVSNRERGAARNYGAQQAHGTYLNFFDSDDLAYPNHLSIAKKIIDKNKDLPVFAISYDIRDNNDLLLNSKLLNKPVDQFICAGNDLSCNGVFIQKNIAFKNPFSENRILSASEDYELWLRLAARYEFPCFSDISHAVIHHSQQSTLNFNANPLIERKMLMLELAFKDEKVQQKFSDKRKQMEFSAFSYIALHVALTGKNKSLALNYLLKSAGTYPFGIFSRRFAAILKHLIIK
jgi:glycosyltransferase involved in cell wall biosynthesis